MDIEQLLTTLREREINAPQRSFEWYYERHNLLSASVVSAILEKHPWMTKYELLKQKLTFTPPNAADPVSPALVWGIRNEATAIKHYEAETGKRVHEMSLVRHPTIPWLGASPDGIAEDGRLVEIKCPFKKAIKDIPPQYWIQVQIQLECLDLQLCDLYQVKFVEDDMGNIKKVRSRLDTIQRDRDWFAAVYPVLKEFWEDVLRYRTTPQITPATRDADNKRKRSPVFSLSDSEEEEVPVAKRTRRNNYRKYIYFNRDTWVAATELRGPMLNDHLISWLDRYGLAAGYVSDAKPGDRYDFNEFIKEQGSLFEESIIADLRGRFGNWVQQIATPSELFSTQKVRETKDAMSRGVPIIYQAVLHNASTQTYGIADLLVRADYLEQVFPESCEDLDLGDTTRGAPLVGWEWHYRVVEIKYYSLPLLKNGRIGNRDNLKAYKAQVWIYHQALESIQGVVGHHAYIWGRKDRVGIVDFATSDAFIAEMARHGVEWIREMKTEGADWNPITHPDLRPNMCNRMDEPWHSVKKDLAETTDEVSLLWNCGPKDRETAATWCELGAALDVADPKSRIQKQLIEVNRQRAPRRGRKSVKHLPRRLTTCQRAKFAPPTRGCEVYVDFETVSDISFQCDVENLIFMIGIGWESAEGEWMFQSFVLEDFTYEAEERMIRTWMQFVRDLGATRLHHWSPAEPRFLRKSVARYGADLQEAAAWIPWHDLLTPIRKVPIVVRGSFNFSLKSMARAMHKHGMIPTTWDSGDGCGDGLSAMLIAIDVLRNGNRPEMMNEVVKYNEVDCRVMYDILGWIRTTYGV